MDEEDDPLWAPLNYDDDEPQEQYDPEDFPEDTFQDDLAERLYEERFGGGDGSEGGEEDDSESSDENEDEEMGSDDEVMESGDEDEEMESDEQKVESGDKNEEIESDDEEVESDDEDEEMETGGNEEEQDEDMEQEEIEQRRMEQEEIDPPDAPSNNDISQEEYDSEDSQENDDQVNPANIAYNELENSDNDVEEAMTEVQYELGIGGDDTGAEDGVVVGPQYGTAGVLDLRPQVVGSIYGTEDKLDLDLGPQVIGAQYGTESTLRLDGPFLDTRGQGAFYINGEENPYPFLGQEDGYQVTMPEDDQVQVQVPEETGRREMEYRPGRDYTGRLDVGAGEQEVNGSGLGFYLAGDLNRWDGLYHPADDGMYPHNSPTAAMPQRLGRDSTTLWKDSGDGGDVYLCDTCGMQFRDRLELRYHIRSVCR